MIEFFVVYKVLSKILFEKYKASVIMISIR